MTRPTELGEAGGFDSVAYWQERHDRYRSDVRGVGNVSLDADENLRIYEAIDAYLQKLVGQLGIQPGARVLDLGCGIGMLADVFIRAGMDYVGVDVSETAIGIARERHPRGRFEVANIAALPLHQPFDLIVERTVFIHLIEDGYWQAVLAEVKRLLSPDGTFLLFDSIPATPEEAPPDAVHVKFRRSDVYQAEFDRLGLEFDMALRADVASKMPLSPTTHLARHTR